MIEGTSTWKRIWQQKRNVVLEGCCQKVKIFKNAFQRNLIALTKDPMAIQTLIVNDTKAFIFAKKADG